MQVDRVASDRPAVNQATRGMDRVAKIEAKVNWFMIYLQVLADIPEAKARRG